MYPFIHVIHRLWDVLRLGVQIFWNLRNETWDFVDSEMMLSTLYNIAQLCVKTLSKSERKSVGAINVTGRVVGTLEQSVTLLYRHGQAALADPHLSPKQQQSVKREIASEIVSH